MLPAEYAKTASTKTEGEEEAGRERHEDKDREKARGGQESRQPEKRGEDKTKKGLKSDETGGDINMENGGESDI